MVRTHDPEAAFPMSRAAPYVELSAPAAKVAPGKEAAHLASCVGSDQSMNLNIATVLAAARQYASALTSSPRLLAHDTPHPAGMHEIRRRGPHPGDILFWVACVGGVGLLLLASTT
jgi:hypothetical protein